MFQLLCQLELNLRVIHAIAVVNILIGAGFSILGAWMILPFAGLEVIALLAVTYYWFRYCRVFERIQFFPEEIRIEQCNLLTIRSWTCQRFWSKAHVLHGTDWYLPRIRLGCRNSQLEVGQFLNQEDKKKLIHELAAHIQIVHQT